MLVECADAVKFFSEDLVRKVTLTIRVLIAQSWNKQTYYRTEGA